MKDLKTTLFLSPFSYIYYCKEVILNLESFRKSLILLHRTHLLTRKQMRKLLHYNPSLNKVHKLSIDSLRQILSISYEKAANLINKIHNKSFQKETIQIMKNYNIVTIIDDDYPTMLKTIQDPPLVLYTLGNKNLLNETPSLSVIGTRNPSVKAREKLSLIVTPIVKANWVIVSGMAKGVDRYAHELALSLGGKTIAVLGSGFEHIYPKENTFLFNVLCQKGLVITEYPPHIRPARYHFPERNRIISGLTIGTLVIEATTKSGTIITVDQALDQGREVYAIPDSPLVRQAEGCNKLIQEGATLVTSGEQILKDFIKQGHYLINN